MRILLTNDDGIYAPGLQALFNSLKREHDVFVVAPETEQSAVGHSITLSDPIRVKKIKKNGEFLGYGLSGAPADCVRLGLGELVEPPIDAVVSGINKGANVGINILYSGTVSAATEAAILGKPAVALSLNSYKDPDFSTAAKFGLGAVNMLAEAPPLPGTCWNINIPDLPAEKIKGAVWTPQLITPSGEEFSRRKDPRGNIYYWRGIEIAPRHIEPDSDYNKLAEGYITITPVGFDMTHRKELSRLKALNIDLSRIFTVNM